MSDMERDNPEKYEAEPKPTVERSYVRHFSLLEYHATDAREQDFPDPTDIVVIEESSGRARFTPAKVIEEYLAHSRNIDPTSSSRFPESVGVTDINVPDNPNTLGEYLTATGIGTLAGALGLEIGNQALNKHLKDRDSSDNQSLFSQEGSITRRNFLRGLFAGGVSMTTAGIATDPESISQKLLTRYTQFDRHGDTPVARYLQDLHASLVDEDDKNVEIHIRNLFNVAKMDAVSRKLSELDDHKQINMVSIFGHSHSKIRDLLQEDPEIVRDLTVIVCPKELIQELSQRNGGLKNLCTSFISSREKQPDGEITPILDQSLLSRLESKLNS